MKKLKEFFDKTTTLATLVLLVFSMMPIQASAVVSTVGSVDSFTLVDATTNVDITNLHNGKVINYDAIGTEIVNIRANVSGNINSVSFMSDCKIDNQGDHYTRTEGTAPYAVSGDSGGNYYDWTYGPGTCTLTAVPEYDGNIGNPRTITVHFYDDGVKPQTTISSPVAGNYYNAFTVSGVATDDNSDVKSVEVFFKEMPKKWGYDYKFAAILNPSTGEWYVNVNGSSGNYLPDGNWHIRVIVHDNAGNRDNSTVVDSIYVDTVVPKGSIVSPTNGSYSNTGIIKVVADITDINLDYVRAKIRTLEKKSNGKRVAETNWKTLSLVAGKYEETFDISNFEERDDYEVCVEAIDMAGNSKWLWPRPVITYDITNPKSDVTSPDSSIVGLPEYQNMPVFDVAFNATDNLSGVNFVELFYRKDSGEWKQYGLMTSNSDSQLRFGYISDQTKFAPNETVSFDTNLTGGDGFYEFYSIATDYAGNVEGQVKSTALNVKGTPEVPEIEVEAYTIVDTQAPTITVSPLTVDIFVGDTFNEMNGVSADETVVWSYDSNNLNTSVAGTYTVIYNATDMAGNAAAEVVRTVNVLEPPVTVVPASTILTPVVFAAPATNDGYEEVLGETDENNSDGNGDVAGQENENEESSEDNNDDVAGVFGIAWYWWILILIIAGGGYYYYTSKKK